MQVFSKINLDLLRPAVQVIVHAKQNDKAARFVQANLWQGEQPFAPVDVLAVFRAAKPDGTATFYDTNENGDPAIVIDGNVATIELVEQVLTVPGDVAAELNLYTGTGEKLTSFTFTIRIQESVLNDAEISSSDYYNVLTNTLTQAQAAADRAEAAADRAEGLSGGSVKSVNGQLPDNSGAVSIDVGVLTVNGESPDVDGNLPLNFGVLTVNGQTPDGTGAVTIDVGVLTVNGQTPDENGDVTIPAGGVQTVNGQQPDENGNVQIEIATKPRSGSNLLINWDLTNPVNQKGAASYSSVGYTVDMWKKTHQTGTVEVGTGGVVLSNPDTATANLQLTQYIEEKLAGNVTFSVLTSSGLYTQTSDIGTSTTMDTDFGTLRCGTGNSGLHFVQITVKPNTSLTVIAAKLELVEDQTLAHQDAGGNWVLNNKQLYPDELLKCQRYYQLFTTSGARPSSYLDCRPVMRTNYAVGTINIDGNSYYFADSNL